MSEEYEAWEAARIVLCSACGSTNLKYAEHDGPTGVVAPDGGSEQRIQAGYKCLDCGGIEEVAA